MTTFIYACVGIVDTKVIVIRFQMRCIVSSNKDCDATLDIWLVV